MSHQMKKWLLGLGLLAIGSLLGGGTTFAIGATQPRNATLPMRVEQVSSPAGDVASPQVSVALASIGMSDLMSQSMEFAGTFPTGWQVYDAISLTAGSDYFWGTTTFTSAEGMRSAMAVRGGLDGATLTDTADYSATVDSWMVYGPVNLASVWQAQLAFAYYFAPAASGSFTAAVSADYDPINMVGTFSGEALPPTTGWTTRTMDLSPYAGRKVYVAFRYQTPDGGNVAGGPFVDDIHLRANYRVMLPVISKWMLDLSKSASANVVWPGQSLVYSITVHNRDIAEATGVMITDAVPVSTTFAGADGVYSNNGGIVSWSNLTVPGGGSIVRHLTVTVPSDVSSGSVVNKNYFVSVPPSPVIVQGLPVTVNIPIAFFDDFTNPASGWPVGEYDPATAYCWPPPGSWRAGYLAGGGYGVSTACDRAAQLYSAPVRLADTRNFTIEVDLRSTQGDLWASSYGIFFNGIEDLHEVYTVELYQGLEPPDWSIRYWQNFNWSDKIWPPANILWYGKCDPCNGADFAWNHVLVRRVGDIIEVWMGSGKGRNNLQRLWVNPHNAASDSRYNRAGLYHGNFEWNYVSAPPGRYAYAFTNFFLSPAVR